jgi:hypothetical protein
MAAAALVCIELVDRLVLGTARARGAGWKPGRARVSIAIRSGAPVASAYCTQTQKALSGQQKL